MLPNRGFVVANIEAYFDESGSHDGRTSCASPVAFYPNASRDCLASNGSALFGGSGRHFFI
jgi:hypothetical protein